MLRFLFHVGWLVVDFKMTSRYFVKTAFNPTTSNHLLLLLFFIFVVWGLFDVIDYYVKNEKKLLDTFVFK